GQKPLHPDEVSGKAIRNSQVDAIATAYSQRTAQVEVCGGPKGVKFSRQKAHTPTTARTGQKPLHPCEVSDNAICNSQIAWHADTYSQNAANIRLCGGPQGVKCSRQNADARSLCQSRP